MAIGNKLKSLLKNKKMKVTTLASLTNIPEQTLYAIIRRDSSNVDLDILRKICTATEANISYFYSGHSNVQSDTDSSDISEHIAFSVLDLPSKEPNEKHYDIATNYVVLSILENMAEDQDCSPSDVLESILSEHLKSYATDNEMTIVTEDEIDEDMEIADQATGDSDRRNDGKHDENDTSNVKNDSGLPYWMF